MNIPRAVKHSIAAALATALATLAAHAAPVREEAIGVDFPDRLGGFTLKGRTQFPKASDGATTVYEGNDVRGAIYVYDGGVSPIPDGVASQQVSKHFLQTQMALMQASAGGGAKVRPVKGATMSSFPGCGPQFQWRSDAIEMEGREMITRTYLTGYHNRFVKLRVTHPRGSDAGAEQFVQDVRRLLGKCA